MSSSMSRGIHPSPRSNQSTRRGWTKQVRNYLTRKPFIDEDHRKRFQKQFHSNGLNQTLVAIAFLGIGAIITYAVYGLFLVETPSWTNSLQVFRLLRAVVLLALLFLGYCFRDQLLKHWATVATIVVILVYVLSVAGVYQRVHVENIPRVEGMGWRAIATQLIVIAFTFAFIKISLERLLIVASISSAALITFVFSQTSDIVLSSTALTVAIIGGSLVWINSYIRERQNFDRNIELEYAALRARRSALAATEAESKARALSEKQTKMARALTHDIRQPMAALGIHMALLKTHADGDNEMQRALNPVRHALDALWLQVEKIASEVGQGGEVVVNTTVVDVNAVVSAAVALFAPLAREQGIRLEQSPDPKNKEILAITCAASLAGILQSLISNAIKHHRTKDHGSPRRIVVGATSTSNAVFIRTIDNGVGIKAQAVGRIFDEGYTCEKSHGDDSSGLGLFNVRRTVSTLSSHYLTVASKVGSGSVFKLRMPKASREPASAPSPISLSAFRQQTLPSAEQPLRGSRTLIVEDDPSVLHSLTALCEHWGALVVATSSFPQAQQTLLSENRPFDLILCDYDLGESKTGIDFIRFANGYYDHPVACVIISGSSGITPPADLSAPWISKPFDPDSLLETAWTELQLAATEHPN